MVVPVRDRQSKAGWFLPPQSPKMKRVALRDEEGSVLVDKMQTSVGRYGQTRVSTSGKNDRENSGRVVRVGVSGGIDERAVKRDVGLTMRA